MASNNVNIKIDWDVLGFLTRQKPAIVERLRRVGKIIKAAIQNEISNPFAIGSGTAPQAGSRQVVRWKPKRTGVPSRPGEAPKKDLGELHQSIHYRVDSRSLKLSVYSNSHKARQLELGTRTMAARPFMRTALYRVWPYCVKVLAGKG